MSFGANPFSSYTFGDDGQVKYSIAANDITSGTPDLDTAAISQDHSVDGVDITLGSPTLGTSAFNQGQTLSTGALDAGNPT